MVCNLMARFDDKAVFVYATNIISIIGMYVNLADQLWGLGFVGYIWRNKSNIPDDYEVYLCY